MMTRMKIEDLPVEAILSEQEQNAIQGGIGYLLPAIQKVRGSATDSLTDEFILDIDWGDGSPLS